MTTPAPANTVEIDGYTYQLSPLDAWQGLETFQTVMKIAGPAMAQLAQLASKEGSVDMGGALGGLGEAVTKTLTSVPPSEVRALVAKLLTGCLVTMPESGKTVPLMPIFGVHFQQKLMSVFKLVGFAVDVNYSDFSAGLKKLGAKLAAKLSSGDAPPVIESKTAG